MIRLTKAMIADPRDATRRAGGVRAMVPFTADAGANDVVVTVGDDASNAATFTVR